MEMIKNKKATEAIKFYCTETKEVSSMAWIPAHAIYHLNFSPSVYFLVFRASCLIITLTRILIVMNIW